MTPNEYIDNVLRSESSTFGNLNERILHGVLGVGTEAGEIQNAVKKSIFYGRQLDKTNLKEEIGDILWYIAILLNECDWTFEDVMERNIAKLRKRYPEQFTDEAANNRDLKGERAVLEDESIL